MELPWPECIPVDCQRIVDVIQERLDLTISLEQAEEFWGTWSAIQEAGWLHLPQKDGELTHFYIVYLVGPKSQCMLEEISRETARKLMTKNKKFRKTPEGSDGCRELAV